MAGGGRPPEVQWLRTLRTRVQEGLQEWQRFHYGDADTPRDPEQARRAAIELTYLIQEPASQPLTGEAVKWAADIENGVELLVDTELFSGQYEGSDVVDYVPAMGSMYMKRREARHVVRGRAAAWSLLGFCVGAGIAALITTLWACM